MVIGKFLWECSFMIFRKWFLNSHLVKTQLLCCVVLLTYGNVIIARVSSVNGFNGWLGFDAFSILHLYSFGSLPYRDDS